MLKKKMTKKRSSGIAAQEEEDEEEAMDKYVQKSIGCMSSLLNLRLFSAKRFVEFKPRRKKHLNSSPSDCSATPGRDRDTDSAFCSSPGPLRNSSEEADLKPVSAQESATPGSPLRQKPANELEQCDNSRKGQNNPSTSREISPKEPPQACSANRRETNLQSTINESEHQRHSSSIDSPPESSPRASPKNDEEINRNSPAGLVSLPMEKQAESVTETEDSDPETVRRASFESLYAFQDADTPSIYSDCSYDYDFSSPITWPSSPSRSYPCSPRRDETQSPSSPRHKKIVSESAPWRTNKESPPSSPRGASGTHSDDAKFASNLDVRTNLQKAARDLANLRQFIEGMKMKSHQALEGQQNRDTTRYLRFGAMDADKRSTVLQEAKVLLRQARLARDSKRSSAAQAKKEKVSANVVTTSKDTETFSSSVASRSRLIPQPQEGDKRKKHQSHLQQLRKNESESSEGHSGRGKKSGEASSRSSSKERVGRKSVGSTPSEISDGKKISKATVVLQSAQKDGKSDASHVSEKSCEMRIDDDISESQRKDTKDKVAELLEKESAGNRVSAEENLRDDGPQKPSKEADALSPCNSTFTEVDAASNNEHELEEFTDAVEAKHSEPVYALPVTELRGLAGELEEHNDNPCFRYIADVLKESGLLERDTEVVLHSVDDVVDPQIFHKLEERYSRGRQAEPSEQQIAVSRSQRELVFNVVNEILCKKLATYLLQPWTCSANNSSQNRPCGPPLLRKVWIEFEGLQPTAGLPPASATTILLDNDFSRTRSQWCDYPADFVALVEEIEELMFYDLITETVSENSASFHEKYSEEDEKEGWTPEKRKKASLRDLLNG